MPCKRQDRHREEEDRVEDDLEAGLVLAADDGHHRDAGLRVLVLHEQRQRPEVGRRPEEHDREQQDRRPADGPAHGGPADERRHRARRAADHDVLRRAALEPDRVDEDVAQEAAEAQQRGGGVHEQRQLDQ